MEKEKCILCGASAGTGLHVLGCLICFPCEKRLVHGLIGKQTMANVCHLYASARLEG